MSIFQSPDEFPNSDFPIVLPKQPEAKPFLLKVDNYMLTVIKEGEPLFRVNTEDSRALFVINGLLRGILKGNLIRAELEDLTNIIESVIKGNEAGS